jgi:toxin FitB
VTSGVTCDSSVLLAALMPWQVRHDDALAAVDQDVDVLVAHVIAETFSVATRLPEPFRTSTSTMIGLLESLPYEAVSLAPSRVLPALRRMSGFGVAGGQIYDGLIAATAVEHDLTLVTLDRRARNAYDALGVNLRSLA